jgi:hypothetical protein
MHQSAYFLVRVRYGTGTAVAPEHLQGQAEHVGTGRRVEFRTTAELMGFLSGVATDRVSKLKLQQVTGKTDAGTHPPATPLTHPEAHP